MLSLARLAVNGKRRLGKRPIKQEQLAITTERFATVMTDGAYGFSWVTITY
ncbi:MAG: hypothetical protein AAF633_09390 [Chloroflexota bacterium]